MSRNASGTYTLPAGNPVVAHTLATSTWANSTLADLSTEVTDSLSRSGKGGMLAPLLLVDGAAGAPALTFTNESSSGLYRAGANALRFAVAGLNRVLWNAGATDPHTQLLSQVAAGTVVADFDIRSANTRTAGTLLQVYNNTQLRFAITNGLGASFVSETAAAGTGTDLLLNTVAARTAGLLFDIQNAGGSKLRVDPAGRVLWGQTAELYADAANASLTLFGNRSAADSGPDIILTTRAARTAGGLLSVQNNSAEKFGIGFDGRQNLQSPLILQLASDQVIELRGNRNAGSATTDVQVNTSNTRTAGFLFSVMNNGTNEADFRYDGALFFRTGTGSAILTSAADASLLLFGNRNAASTGAADVATNTSVLRTAGRIFEAQNNGTAKFGVDFNGEPALQGGKECGFVVSAVDQANGTTTFATAGLSFTAPAGNIWFEAFLVCDQSVATDAIKFQVTAAGGATAITALVEAPGVASAVDIVALSTGVALASFGVTTRKIVRFTFGGFAVGAGAVDVQFARSSGTGTETVRAGSILRWRRV